MLSLFPSVRICASIPKTGTQMAGTQLCLLTIFVTECSCAIDSNFYIYPAGKCCAAQTAAFSISQLPVYS